MRNYLKTVDFMNTKTNLFKINPIYPLEYRQRKRNYMTLNIKVKIIIH